jgi:hypothetical protein
MTFEKLKAAGVAMSEKEIEDTFRSLVNDQRFAAVVAVILNHREQYVNGGTIQQLANSHGSLAHNAGSVHALNVLLGKIQQVSNPPKKRGQAAPVEDVESD